MIVFYAYPSIHTWKENISNWMWYSNWVTDKKVKNKNQYSIFQGKNVSRNILKVPRKYIKKIPQCAAGSCKPTKTHSSYLHDSSAIRKFWRGAHKMELWFDQSTTMHCVMNMQLNMVRLSRDGWMKKFLIRTQIVWIQPQPHTDGITGNRKSEQ